MKKPGYTVARMALGLMLFMFGLNKFMHFMPMPDMPEPMAVLMKALVDTGFYMPIVGLIMLVTGIMFLTNMYVALAAVLLAPISVNLVLTHVFLDPAGIAMAALVFALNLYLLLTQMDKYAPMFKQR